MGLGTLREELGACHLLMLDTMIFSYHLSAHPRYASLTSAILSAVEEGVVEGLTTTITLAELLTRPAQEGDRRAMRDYEMYLTKFPNLKVVPLDTSLARAAAVVRAHTNFWC